MPAGSGLVPCKNEAVDSISTHSTNLRGLGLVILRLKRGCTTPVFSYAPVAPIGRAVPLYGTGWEFESTPGAPYYRPEAEWISGRLLSEGKWDHSPPGLPLDTSKSAAYLCRMIFARGNNFGGCERQRQRWRN